MNGEDISEKKKPHRDRQSGRKAERKLKKAKNQHVEELKNKNPKAFTFNSAVRAERRFRRKQDVNTKRQHIPLVDRTPLEPPPVIVAVVGPPKVGKTVLIECLIKNFTRQPMTSLKGPVTLVSGKKRRITLMECNNDINSMIDIAKIADLVLLLVDASFGFEMEIFEFLNICQVHGMPRIMGVLTHLDMLKNNRQLKKTKKILKHRFWTEVYAGAKLFYLSGLLHGEYMRNEVKNLGRFISVMKFRPLTWRTTHSYILADRLEDLTPPEVVRQNPKVDRLVSLYGYVRGVALNKMSSIHIPGCGDLKIHDMLHLPDPCPLPDKLKKRTLVEKEKLVYAPFSGVGGIVYDKDAVYVELGGSHSHDQRERDKRPEKALVNSLLDTQETLDMKMARSELQLFSGTAPITSADVTKTPTGLSEKLVNYSRRTRRKVIFSGGDEDVKEQKSSDSDDDDDDDSEVELDDPDDSVEENISGDGDGSLSLEKAELSKAGTKASGKIKLLDDSDSAVQTEITQKSPNKEDLNNRNVKEQKKKAKSAIAAVESKIKSIMAEESDDFEDESDDEDITGIDGDESEEMEKSDESDIEVDEAPIKKRKLREDNKTEEKHSPRYRDIGSNEDHAIHNKVSNLLLKLETGDRRTPKKNEDSELEDVGKEQNAKSHKRKYEQAFELNQFSSNEESSDNDSDVEEEEDGDVDNDESDGSGGDDEIEDDSENDDGQEESAVQWKSNLAQKAADAFLERQATTQNLWKLVYGELKQTEDEGEADGDGGEVGGLFRVASRKQQQQQEQKDLMNAEDCTKFVVKQVRDWMHCGVRDTIRDCFVTGKWKDSEDAAELLRLDKEDDEDLFGDFEDLETGEKHISKTEEKLQLSDEADDDHILIETGPATEEKKLSREELQDKKRKLKEKFDAEYDDKDGGKTYYDELKQEVDHQAQLNKSEFEGLDDAVRIQLEGYRPGMYVRVEVGNVPCELITNFDPTYPLIVGGLLAGEENIGFVQVRIKKHRWYKKILKTQDPLIISLGWRRFQTLPVYSKLEDNLRHRMLKYTPEHVTCMAHFWGPITPQSTGFLAVQDVASRQADFRISATGSVVELDKSTQITKKLKLTGTPYKIYKKTAFIRDMFNSTLEVAKFEGGKLKTVSGIRGQIKKAVSKPEGAFRATFEDKILLSDIVFCRTWYQVQVPKLYNPVTSLLLPPEQKNSWRGMKTVGQLKREKGIRSDPASDSLYKPIEREQKVFRPLVIPRSLQKELPYKDKPKVEPKVQNKKLIEASRIAVVREPHEHKVAALMKKLKVTYNHKQEQLKEATKKRIQDHRKEIEQADLRKLKRQKELRKQVFRTLSKMEAKNKGKKR